MNGIVFLKTRQLSVITRFYVRQVGCRIWLEQPECVILRHGNLLFGFCERHEVDSNAMLTFFYDSRDEVDRMHDRLALIATMKPTYNEIYQIYQFFAEDPDGRMIECQYFDHPIATYRSGEELLRTRRSVRKYDSREVADDVLERVLDTARFAPSSYNCQPCYFEVIRDRDTLAQLAAVNGDSSEPIGRAPSAIAVCVDTDISQFHVHDGCLMVHQLQLAAWYEGLGTCWIARMDTKEVKNLLNVPHSHHVATVTPVGYPRYTGPVPVERKPLTDYRR